VNYWEECISEAVDEVGLRATKEQIATIASWVEGAHENYGTANGHDCMADPTESKAQQELRELKDKNKKREEWEAVTEPCVICNTTGVVRDGWGRDCMCDCCGGEGRTRRRY